MGKNVFAEIEESRKRTYAVSIIERKCEIIIRKKIRKQSIDIKILKGEKIIKREKQYATLGIIPHYQLI